MKNLYSHMALRDNVLNKIAVSAGLTWGGVALTGVVACLMAWFGCTILPTALVCTLIFILGMIGGLFLCMMETIADPITNAKTLGRRTFQYALLGTYLPVAVLGILLLFFTRSWIGKPGTGAAVGTEFIASKL